MDNLEIFIADNQPLTRIGIISVLTKYFNSQVIFDEFETKEKLFEALNSKHPQLLIIDFELFNFDSISELVQIKNISPETGILIITDNQIPDNISKVINCGINNYILKSSNESCLIEAVNATINNKKYFSPELLDVILSYQKENNKIRSGNLRITNAELEIIRLISQGLTNKEIADSKNLSYHTIISHRKNIFRKLNINNSSELMMYAMRSGIIDTTEYYI